MDRSAIVGVVRDATNAATNEFNLNMANIIKKQVETHCNLRLKYDKIPNPAIECGGSGIRW